MDQNKRLILFILLTGLVWFGWFGFVQPKFFPPPKRDVPAAEVDEEVDEGEAWAANDDAASEASLENDDQSPELAAPNNPPRHELKIGSLDPKSGYFQEVILDSRGASVATIELNDPRYRDLEDRDVPLHVVGGSDDPPLQTLAMAVAEVDEQLAEFETDTAHVDWKVERTIPDENNEGINRGVVFSLRAPDGSVELTKTYTLRKPKAEPSVRSRDIDPDGYILDVEFGFRNLTDQPQTLVYTLQGPEGLPLENETHTSKYRELELGFLERDGSLSHASLIASDVTEEAAAADLAAEARAAATAADRRLVAQQRRVEELEARAKASPSDKAVAAELATATAKLKDYQERALELTNAAQDANAGLERWNETPFRYLGVEVQYFAALLFPEARPVEAMYEDPWIASGEPKVVAKGAKAEFNDISFQVTSTPIVIPPQGEVTQSWFLFAGPKREELLAPIGAEKVLDLSWYAVVSPAMLWVLDKLHSAGLPYWLAIIGLTVIVRGLMFPISRKQAIGAAKMKELQPKLTELKAKYGNDQEKFLRAQMELFRNHGYGPLGPMASGCLPVFLQLPIFIGLYQALQTSVDLRQAEFLWIDNLAAPDELFRMPFSLPYLGADFNLLPLITVVLFYIQQKLFMPPATTPEQEAQYKMMNFMMLFMGVFFYHVPAGLCIYFIASSLWSIAERTLLSKTKAAHIGAAEAAEIEHEIEELEHEAKPSKKKKGSASARGAKSVAATEPRKTTWLQGLLEKWFEAAEQARKQAELGGDNKTRPNGPKSKSRPRS